MRRAANRQTDGEGEKSVGESRGEGGRSERLSKFFAPSHPCVQWVHKGGRERGGGTKNPWMLLLLVRRNCHEEEKEKRRRRKVAMAKSVSLLLLLPAVIAQRRRRRRNDSGEKSPYVKKRQFALPHLRTRERELLFIPFMRERCWRLNRKMLIFSIRPFPSTFPLFLTLVYSKLQWAKKKRELHPWTLEIFLSSSSSCGMCAS